MNRPLPWIMCAESSYGFDLLGSAGAGAVTMRAVTRQANLSPRYCCESFDNREVLVSAVYDYVEAALRERLSAITSTHWPVR